MLLPDSVFSVVPDISRCYFQRTCNGALSQCRHSTLSSTTSQLWGSIYTDANYYLRELFASSFVRIHANTYSPWRATNLACECVVKLTRLVFPAAYAELQATIWGVGFIGGEFSTKTGKLENTVLVCSQHPLKPSIRPKHYSISKQTTGSY